LDDLSLHQAIEALQSLLTPLKVGEFSEKIGKVSVYIGSIERSWKGYSSALESATKQTDPEKRKNALDSGIQGFKNSAQNSARFAKMNLDQAMRQAPWRSW
jgi:adenine specific DNA methylase Mod